MKSALTLSHSSNLKLNKTQSISFPRSGHHLLVDCLIKYFNHDEDSNARVDKSLFNKTYKANAFVYCEFYKHCRESPCKNSKVNFQKNHDFHLFNSYHQNIFNLNQSRLTIDSKANYLIQFRENPVFSIVSEYKRVIKKSVSPKFKAEDSYDFFNAFCADYLDYWVSFVNKWILNTPTNALVFSYESFLEKPHKIFSLVLNSLGVSDPDINLINKIIDNSNIKAKSNIKTFKYYESYLTQINDKYFQDLRLQLSNSSRLQNTLFISEKNSNSRKMTAKKIMLRENEKMKSNYEKSKVFENALESVENSLSSKVKIIKFKDEIIENLQKDILILNESLKSSQNNPIEIEKKYQAQIESLQSSLNSIKKDKESLVLQIQKYSQKSSDSISIVKQTKSKISSLKKKKKNLKKKNKELINSLKDFDNLKSEIIDYQELISRNNNRIKQLKKKARKKGKKENKDKKSIKKLTLFISELKKLNNQLTKEASDKLSVYNNKTNEIKLELQSVKVELDSKLGQVNALESYLSQTRIELNENTAKLNLAEGNLIKSDNALNDLKKIFEEYQIKNKTQQKEIKEISALNTTLSNDLDKSNKTNTELNSTIESLNSEKNELIVEIKNAYEAKEVSSNQVSTLENYLSQEISEKKESEDKLQVQIDEKENIITKLKSEIDLNLKDIKVKANSEKELNAEIINVKNKFQDLQNLNDFLANKIKDHVIERDVLREHSQTQINEIQLYKSEIKANNVEVLKLNQELSNSKIKFNDLSTENKKQLNLLSSLNKEQQNQLSALRNFNNSQIDEILLFRSELKANHNEVVNLNQELSNSKDQIKDLSANSKKQLDELSVTISEQQNQLEYLRNIKSELLNKISNLESSLSHAEKYEQVHTKKIIELRSIILKLQEELSENKILIHRLEGNNRSTQNKNHKLEDLLENNDKELFHRAQLIRKLKIEKKRNNDDNIILKSKVYTLESSLKAVKSSYSWKIGYKITRIIFGLFGWTSFIKKRL